MTSPHTESSDTSSPPSNGDLSPDRKLFHSLSNKLLPIVVFSELALQRCEDDQLKRQIEKIHVAAEQARDILIEIRSLQTGAET